MSKCFFIGHRDTPSEVKPLLLDVINRHITEYGVTQFYVGHNGAFDRMVADTLCQAKKNYPYIENYLLLAYHPAIRNIDKPDGFTSTIFIEGQEKVPPRFAITRLNQQIIREADYLICYVRYITGGSHKLLDFAKARAEKGKLVISNLTE